MNLPETAVGVRQLKVYLNDMTAFKVRIGHLNGYW